MHANCILSTGLVFSSVPMMVRGFNASGIMFLKRIHRPYVTCTYLYIILHKLTQKLNTNHYLIVMISHTGLLNIWFGKKTITSLFIKWIPLAINLLRFNLYPITDSYFASLLRVIRNLIKPCSINSLYMYLY